MARPAQPICIKCRMHHKAGKTYWCKACWAQYMKARRARLREEKQAEATQLSA